MKKTKVYRPRRGLRFARGPKFGSPAAGFIGGGPIVRSRPSLDTNARADTVQMSGSVMRSLATTAATSSLLDGSISQGRLYERGKLNAVLLGRPAFSVGARPFPSPTTTDSSPTGSFESPSWTHSSVGFNQAFVGLSLSSSRYEDLVLNSFTSGSELLEQTAVPASAKLHYSKETRFRTVTVKKTASLLDTAVRSGSWVPSSFVAGSGALFSSVTGVADFLVSGEGTFKDSSPWAPASILIPVNESGRIRDIRVWVEWVYVSQSGDPLPLGGIGMSLRSPNLAWGNAHPIRNDPNLLRIYTSPGQTFSLLATTEQRRRYFAGTGSAVDSFYRDSFLLWEGIAIFDSNNASNSPTFLGGLDGGQFMSNFPCWNNDRGMRTIFCDGAATPNPRHNNGPTSGNFGGSPNAGVGRNNAFGSNVPWTSDSSQGGAATFLAAGSPPTGWLSGPGGTAGANEWPTTGVNYGANLIRPIYPLLDPLVQKKQYTGVPVPMGPDGFAAPDVSALENFRPGIWAGSRPGLRGTEASGTWELLLLAGGGASSNVVPNMYFRQVRLEFLLETPTYTRVDRFVRRRSPRLASPQIVSSISGSDSAFFPFGFTNSRAGWDFWVNDTYAVSDTGGEIGSSFGIGQLTGSRSTADSALIYGLSGSLAGLVGSNPSWLFSGPGGMPVIPESSASLVPIVIEPIRSMPFSDVLQPRRSLDFPQRLAEVASDANPQMSLRDLASGFLSSSAT